MNLTKNKQHGMVRPEYSWFNQIAKGRIYSERFKAFDLFRKSSSGS